MEKDFAKWHFLKTKLQKRDNQFTFSEGDVWLCALGLNLGHEEDGKGDIFLRPVVVLKKINSDTFWAVPLTSQKKMGNYYYLFDFGGKQNTAMVAQIKLLDRKRLWRKKGRIGQDQFSLMVKMVKELLP